MKLMNSGDSLQGVSPAIVETNLGIDAAVGGSQVETKRRLLEAAGEVFADQGYRNATVRDICHRARANVAAVNYHFGDKQGLYLAVLRYACECSGNNYPACLGASQAPTGEEKLLAYVRATLGRMFDEGRPAWQGKLEAREMIEPTVALDSLVEEHIRPRAMVLRDIVVLFLGPDANPTLIRHSCGSIVGQCLFL